MVIINNFLTLVGGEHRGYTTNLLFSLTGEGSGRGWTKKFPRMPTKRDTSAALCTGTALIVAGGKNEDSTILKTVEVLNTDTLQWSTVADLPEGLYLAPIAVCGDQVYIKGVYLYTCSVTTLIQPGKPAPDTSVNQTSKAWRMVAKPPVIDAPYLSILGRLLVVGGSKFDNWNRTSAIRMYNPTTNSWEVISQMKTPRRRCIAAVLPNNQLMVVGGETDSVELGTIQHLVRW